MSTLEGQPLLPPQRGDSQPNHESTRSGSSTSCCHLCKVPKWLCFCTLFIVGFFFILLLSCLVISFSVEFHSYKNPNVSRILSETRSSNFSLLDRVPWNGHFSACAETRLHLELVDAQSSVEVREIPCDTIPMSPFDFSIPYNRIEIIGVPFTLFSENRSPNNYLINGTLQVDIKNATLSNSSTSMVNFCLFTNSDKYVDFSRSGSNWKDFTKDADCRRATVHSGEHNHTISFNITTPSFVFLGIACEDSLEIDMGLIVAGYTIGGFGNQSIKSCQLNGDNVECDFKPSARSNQSVCIVAYEEGDGTGSHHYSKVEITQTNPADVCARTVDILGFTALGLLVFMIIIIISAAVVIRQKCRSKRNDSESRADTIRGNINSKVEDTDRQSNTPSVHSSEDPATDRSTLVVTSSSKIPFSSKPTTVKDGSEAARPPAPNANIPIEETVQGPGLHSPLHSKSTDNDSDSKFSYGHSETLSD